MDKSLIVVVAGSTLLFFGLIAYKAWWFIRKVQDAPREADTPQAQSIEKAPSAKEESAATESEAEP
ncbi:hypothetical protein [Congregibacter sp.]|uniref:hypothetical protein n=1 Tax=Congregibacter sp. TaxID=2744308 RepID=UPI003F6C787C